MVSHLSAKNYRNLWKFDEVLTRTNLLSFFWDTMYMSRCVAGADGAACVGGAWFILTPFISERELTFMLAIWGPQG